MSAGAAAGTARTGDLGAVATVDATPSDPNDATSTHSIVVPLGSAAESPGSPFRDVVVDYSVGAPEAGVSNVGAGTIERIGIDRDGDAPGTRIDVRATITSVTGMKDGAAVRIATAGNHTLRRGDEVVVVLRPVQNPQSAGNATVSVTINSQNAADTANGTVVYEYNSATVTFANQSTAGETVTVSSVTLSEGGFVAIQNKSGANPGAIRGASAYLTAGTHRNVSITLDVPVQRDGELVAQVYTDANGDHRFQYASSGGDEDPPYRNRDGNILAADAALVTHTSGEMGTPTATPDSTDGGATPTTTEGGGTTTATPTATATMDGTPTDSPTTDGDGTPADGTETGGQPGFGVAAALVALVGTALLTRRTA